MRLRIVSRANAMVLVGGSEPVDGKFWHSLRLYDLMVAPLASVLCPCSVSGSWNIIHGVSFDDPPSFTGYRKVLTELSDVRRKFV